MKIISTAHKIRYLCISLATNIWVSEQSDSIFFSFILPLLNSFNLQDFVNGLEVVFSSRSMFWKPILYGFNVKNSSDFFSLIQMAQKWHVSDVRHSISIDLAKWKCCFTFAEFRTYGNFQVQIDALIILGKIHEINILTLFIRIIFCSCFMRFFFLFVFLPSFYTRLSVLCLLSMHVKKIRFFMYDFFSVYIEIEVHTECKLHATNKTSSTTAATYTQGKESECKKAWMPSTWNAWRERCIPHTHTHWRDFTRIFTMNSEY